ncbi:MAG: ATP-binding protein [Candidatus Neomarinimicrobiota bacterium]
MAWSRFSVKVTFRVLAISLVSAVFVWSLSKDYLVVTKFAVAGIWIWLTYDLIRYVRRTNRDLRQFLESLQYMDNVLSVPENDATFRELNLTYNRIINVIRQAKLEKESEHLFFQTTIQHVGVGLIAFRPDGAVELINQAALNLLGLDYLKNIFDLERTAPGLAAQFVNQKSGYQRLFAFKLNDETLKLAVKVVEFKIKTMAIKLVSLQNIRGELEQEELDTWQKLIRVLAHEIMNSITPIGSLAGTILKIFEQDRPVEAGFAEPDQIENIREGLRAIAKRSKGLVQFVQSYRELTRVPKPHLKNVAIRELLESAGLLMHNQLDENGIRLEITVEPQDLALFADEKLISQTILNLLKNSVEALKNQAGGIIKLNAYQAEQQKIIRIADNGSGIAAELLDKIFLPFYSTKTHGTGVGLSLARQIMRLHGGSITAHSSPGQETVFSLTF